MNKYQQEGNRILPLNGHVIYELMPVILIIGSGNQSCGASSPFKEAPGLPILAAVAKHLIMILAL